MLFRSHIPRAPLTGFIEDLRLYEDYAGDHKREAILPSGTVEMVFNLLDDELRIYGPAAGDPCRRFPGALISGPYARPFMSDTAEEASILQVHFRPGGAAPLLGLPAGALANTHVALRTVWGPAADTLRERLCAASGPAARFRILEDALLARLTDRPARHGAVHRALGLIARTHGRARIRDVARAVDLSQRRFIELFAAEVGLTPKLFARLRRFHRALALSQAGAAPGWAGIAADCGYFDQSHLIRDFVEFSGAPPAEYRRRRDGLDRAGIHVKRNHLPLAS